MPKSRLKRRGGWREGAGRKPLFQQRQRRCTITIPDRYAEQLIHIGQGNLSAGVRKLLEVSTPAESYRPYKSSTRLGDAK